MGVKHDGITVAIAGRPGADQVADVVSLEGDAGRLQQLAHDGDGAVLVAVIGVDVKERQEGF